MADQKSNSLLSGGLLPWILTTIAGSAFFAHSLNNGPVTLAPVPGTVGSQQVLTSGSSRQERIRRIEEPLYVHFGVNSDDEFPEKVPANLFQVALTVTGSAIPTTKEQKPRPNEDSPGKNQGSKAKKIFEDRISQCELDFLIMTVADPIDSAENYRFDHQLDALHKALAINPEESWIYDGSYLPWEIFRERTAKNSDLALDRKQRWYQKEPGLLVYRKNINNKILKDKLIKDKSIEDKPAEVSVSESLLLVFLVGESPTFGIQREAFVLAVEEIDRLRDLAHKTDKILTTPKWLHDERDRRIPVIGPNFSGAADSLIKTIQLLANRSFPESSGCDELTKKHKTKDFLVLTGSATSIDPEQFANSDIPFASTVCRSADERKAVLEFLKDDWRPGRWKRKIAWLVESGSSSGQSFYEYNPPQKFRRSRRIATD